MKKIKPCPFCGNKDVSVVIVPTFDPTIAVECQACRTRGLNINLPIKINYIFYGGIRDNLSN